MNCKYCSRPAPKNMQGYCQSCYHYFIRDNKTVYPIPEYGEITYAPNGDCICPFCGKAFRKLGAHFWNFHHLKANKAKEYAGWDHNVKASNIEYRKHMNKIQKEKCITINLIEKGKPTRKKKGHHTKKYVSEMTRRRIIKLTHKEKKSETENRN